MNVDRIVSLILLIALIMSIIVSGNILMEHEELESEYNLLLNKSYCEMYNAKKDIFEKRPVATGLFWKDTDFYCVWALNRHLDAIEETDRHEYCHYLVDNDYEHFCTQYYEVIDK